MPFPNTNFVSRVTHIAATWLQAVNDFINGFPDPTGQAGKVVTSNGAGYALTLPAISTSVDDYTALRALTTPSAGDAVVVGCRAVVNDGGGGVFVYDAADMTTADNGGTVLVAGTARWKRVIDGEVNVLWFEGVDPSGATGSGAASQKALDTLKNVFVPPGVTLLIDQQLNMQPGQMLSGAGETLSILKLGFAGDMLHIVGYCILRDLGLQGNGANFSGQGVVSTGTTPQFLVDHCKITNFTGPCVWYKEDGTGSQSTIIDCEIYRFNQANAGIVLPNPEAYGPARRFINIQCSGGILADVGASDNSMFIGCQGNGIIFAVPGAGVTTWAKKTLLSACRFSTVGATTTVYGEDHSIIGCAFAGALTLGTGTKNSRIVGNTLAGGYVITDSSGSLYNGPPNYIDQYAPLSPLTVTWTSSGVAPALGSGTMDARFTQLANRRTVNITLLFDAATTTYGTGEWIFLLPWTSSPFSASTNVGHFRCACNGLYYSGVCVNSSGSQAITMYTNAAATAVSSAVPAAWAGAGNNLFIQIDLPIA